MFTRMNAQDFRWFLAFTNGRESLEDGQRIISSLEDDNVEKTKLFVANDRQITTRIFAV